MCERSLGPATKGCALVSLELASKGRGTAGTVRTHEYEVPTRPEQPSSGKFPPALVSLPMPPVSGVYLLPVALLHIVCRWSVVQYIYIPRNLPAGRALTPCSPRNFEYEVQYLFDLPDLTKAEWFNLQYFPHQTLTRSEK